METTAPSLSTALATGLVNLLDALIQFLPQLILGFIVLGLGIILAKWAKILIVRGIKSLRLGEVLGTTSLGKFYQASHLEPKLEALAGEVSRWLILYLFLISALDIFGLDDIAELLKNLLNYLPNLLSALIIFLIGFFAAGFIEQLVKNVLAPIDLSSARLAGKVASYTIVIFALIIAVGELGIAKEYILILFSGFVALIVLALGLAFGLGAKDLVAQVLNRWYHHVSLKPLPKKKSA